MKPIICIHGLQGSGKTYLIKTIKDTILGTNSSRYINIKSTFMPLVDMVKNYYELMGYTLSEAQRKKLMLAQSTYGETCIDEDIWTKKWIDNINEHPEDIILVDDIRTEYNLKGLLSMTRPIILFKLDVSEGIRRERLGDKWRDNGGYTEQLLSRPKVLPPNFDWIELNEEWGISIIKNALGKYI